MSVLLLSNSNYDFMSQRFRDIIVFNLVWPWHTWVPLVAASDGYRQVPAYMADICRDWLTNQIMDWCCVAIGFGLSIPQSFAPQLKNRSISPNWSAIFIGTQQRPENILLTSVASTVSTRIYVGPSTSVPKHITNVRQRCTGYTADISTNRSRTVNFAPYAVY